MTDLLPAVAGLVVGWAYFGGLWVTIRNLPKFPNPQRIALTGFGLRAAAALAVLWAVCGDNPAAWGLTMPGFLAARILWCRKLKV